MDRKSLLLVDLVAYHATNRYMSVRSVIDFSPVCSASFTFSHTPHFKIKGIIWVRCWLPDDHCLRNGRQVNANINRVSTVLIGFVLR